MSSFMLGNPWKGGDEDLSDLMELGLVETTDGLLDDHPWNGGDEGGLGVGVPAGVSVWLYSVSGSSSELG